MSSLSRKTILMGLAGVFAAAVAGEIAYNHHAKAEQTYNLCVDYILIPQTLEQADYLKHHAAEAYAALDKKQYPKDLRLVASFMTDMEKGGKKATVTGFNPNGETSILPDGSKRPVGCYIVSLK